MSDFLSDYLQKGVSVDIHSCPIFINNKILHIFQMFRQMLIPSWLLCNSFLKTDPNLSHIKREEEYKGEVMGVLRERRVRIFSQF